MARFEVRHVLDIKAELGEAPLWSIEQNALYWVDIDHKRLNRFDPATGRNRAWDIAGTPGHFNFREGGLVVATSTGYYDFGFAAETLEKIAECPFDGAIFRFNDGKADRQGRMWGGAMVMLIDFTQPPKGTYYRFDGSTVEAGIEGIMVPNGTAFSPDGTIMYRSDWLPEGKAVLKYDYDVVTGTPSNPRTFTTMPDGWGVPDGAAVDVEGCYWAAIPYGDKGRIARFTPDGEVDFAIEMPVLGPTMTSFGGQDMTTLYVTSARLETVMGLPLSPLAGDLFAIETGIRGIPETFTKLR